MATEASKSKSAKRWFPLESNPDVMNKYVAGLGFPTGSFEFCDVLSTEEWALEMVPKPVKAVLLLFPIKDASEAFQEKEKERIQEAGQTVSDKLWFTLQTVGNACGTVAILHAVANCSTVTGGEVALPEGSFFANFLEEVKDKSPEERAAALEADDSIEDAHESSAQEGQTEATEDVNTHFICFVEKDGQLYELDGRKEFPINHGETTPDSLLVDSARVIKGFMDRDPGEMNFAVTALAALAE